MNARAQSQVQTSSSPSFTPAPVNIVQRKCACGGSAGLSGECAECQKEKLVGNSASLVQPKLKIGQPNDKYEQEADRVADEVMRMPEQKVQREVGVEEDENEETVQTKSIASQITPLVQREVGDEEEQEMQAKELPGHTPVVTPQTQAQLNALRGSGQSLPESLRAYYEPRMGVDFSSTRIQTGPVAAEMTRSFNARAFTLGQNIFFSQGEFQPGTDSGKRLLAHELAHIIQQSNNPQLASVQSKPKSDKKKSTEQNGVSIPWDTKQEGEQGLRDSLKNYLSNRFQLTDDNATYVIEKGLLGTPVVEEEGKTITVALKNVAKAAKEEGSFFLDTIALENMASALVKRDVVADRLEALEILKIGGKLVKTEGTADFTASEKNGNGKGTSEEDPLDKTTKVPTEKIPFEENIEEKESDFSDAVKFGVLITTPGSDISENLTNAGKIKNFKEMSHGEIKVHAVKRAVDTLSFCFGLAPPAAEAMANSQKIKIRIPPLRKLRRMTADDSSNALPIVADMSSLEMSFVDELGLSAGNTCENKEVECFFGKTFCLPRLNFSAPSIETARDIDTTLKAVEAATDAVGIFVTLGIFEAAEEGGEFVFKQWLRQQRKKGADAKRLRKARQAGKQLLREKKQVQKKLTQDPDSVEVRVGKHTYRRQADGTWCRFTEKKCGIKFEFGARDVVPPRPKRPRGRLKDAHANVRKSDNRLRREARQAWKKTHPDFEKKAKAFKKKTGNRLEIDHRIPLEYKFLFPKSDPNRFANLRALTQFDHRKKISDSWDSFRNTFRKLGRDPTPTEVQVHARLTDRALNELRKTRNVGF